ncbi:germinal center-associated signaling and motility protein isoform X1 [Callospermophilus lateralis]|uniref:germinal center-associated signaling and motility protein isoform X1 n=1 Tax=Callospermophilus lateralis TaxID=76772 RepID=UPI0040543AF3
MGNHLQRENSFRWQQDTQEMPWKLRLQNTKQRTSRCWDCHDRKECFCLPWKKLCVFKARQDSQKKNEEMTPTPIQDHANQTHTKELCYVLIHHHKDQGRRPSGTSAEVYYENVSCKAERPKESLGGTETEYSLLHVPSTPRHLPSPEDEYELLMPSRISSPSLKQPHILPSPFETQFSLLQ